MKKPIKNRKAVLKKQTLTKPVVKKRPLTHKQTGPGRAERNGLSIIQLFEMFPDEESARKWFEDLRWADGRYCPLCASTDTRPVKNEKPMPYWCSDCRKYFSVKTGTVMQSSRIPLRKWVIALYLMSTNLKGVSSMKIHRDLDVAQSNAWHMIHRIRTAWKEFTALFDGPVEVDETYIGGKEKNKHGNKKLKSGRGPVGKTAVVGMKDRRTKKVQAEVIAHTDQDTLQEFVMDRIEPDAEIYTDEHRGYIGLRNHASVKHGVGQYVEGQIHTNGIESFWAMLKRGYTGTYHKMSTKHLHRYVMEFAGRQNARSLDTIDQMVALALGMVGKRLRYKDLIAE